MTIENIIKLKSNPIYLKFIRENSYWYKILNRYPDKFNDFVNQVRTSYKLRPTDKINKALSTFEMISEIMGALK